MVKKTYILKEIADAVFENQTDLKLKGDTLPASIESIGSRCFKNCSNMELKVIPPNIIEVAEEVFSGCLSIKTLQANGLIARIKKKAFYNCENLDLNNLPDTVTVIEESAFEGCKKLTLNDKDLPRNITEIGNSAFKNCISLKLEFLSPNLLYIGNSSFYGCKSLQLTTLGDHIRKVGTECFKGCRKLKITDWPIELGEVPEGVFEECTDLELSYITSEVKEIKKQAFKDCKSLKMEQLGTSDTINILESAFEGVVIINQTNEDVPFDLNVSQVTNLQIQKDAFKNSNINLRVNKEVYKQFEDAGRIVEGKIEGAFITSINTKPVEKVDDNYVDKDGVIYTIDLISPPTASVIGVQNKSIGLIQLADSITYGGVEYSILTIKIDSFKDCKNLDIPNLPLYLNSIENNAFDGCTSFLSLSCLPDRVKYLGDYCFRDTKVSFRELPDIISSLGEGTFQNCKELVLTRIPIGIKIIPKKCFSGCTKLPLKELPGELTLIDEEAFKDCIQFDVRYPPVSITSIKRGAFENVYTDPRVAEEIKCYTWSSLIVEKDAYKHCDQLCFKISQSVKDQWEKNKNLEHLKNNQVAVEIDTSIISVEKYQNYYVDSKGCSYFLDSENLVAIFLSVPLDFDETELIISESVVIGDNYDKIYILTIIGENACRNNIYIQKLKLPKSIIAIGKSAFENCTNLTEINGNIKYVREYDNRVFYECKYLQSIILNESIEELPEEMCYGCKKLSIPYLPKTLQKIQDKAFYECESLILETPTNNGLKEEVALHANIGSGAFYNCKNLTMNGYTLQNTSIIGTLAFSNCKKLYLKLENLPEKNKNETDITIGEKAFENSGTLLGSIKLSFINISDRMFYNTHLEKLIINFANVKTIGASAFEQEEPNGELELLNADKVLQIGAKAFKNLKKCTLKNTSFSILNSLSESAFYSCNLDREFEDLFPKLEILEDNALYDSNIKFKENLANIKKSGYNSIAKNILCGTDKDHKFTIENEIIDTGGQLFRDMICQNITAFAFKVPLDIKNIFGTIVEGKEKIVTIETILQKHTRTVQEEAKVYQEDISLIQENAFSGLVGLENIIIHLLPSTINIDEITHLIEIEKNAFTNCSNLKKLDLELKYLENIGDSAFENCTRLQFKTYDDVITDKTTARFEKIEKIGASAFKNCTSLISLGDSTYSKDDYKSFITLYPYLYYIGEHAFENCTNLKYPIFPYAGAPIPTQNKNKSTKIIQKYKNITAKTYHSKFNYDDRTKKIYTINEKQEKLEYNNAENMDYEIEKITVNEFCYQNCTSMEMIILPYWLQFIQNCAFKDTKKLNMNMFAHSRSTGTQQNISFNSSCFEGALFSNKKISSGMDNWGIGHFPTWVQNFGSNCFKNTKIDFIDFPTCNRTYSSIGEGAFEECTNLGLTGDSTPPFPDTVSIIQKSAFKNCKRLNFESFGEPYSIQNPGIQRIGDSAFYGCIEANIHDLPKNIIEIGDHAFQNCEKLNFAFCDVYGSKEEFYKNLTDIGNYAFSGCVSLLINYLPKKITIINEGTFQETILEGGEEQFYGYTTIYANHITEIKQ